MSRLTVSHLVNTYLDHGRTWIYNQIDGIPAVDPSVVAYRVVDDGPRQFPVGKLVVLRERAPLRYHWARLFDRPIQRGLGKLAVAEMRRMTPGLAHAHFGHVAWGYLPAVTSARVPLVTSFYGRDMSELPLTDPAWRDRYAELFAYGALFFCEGPVLAGALAKLGCPASKIRVQHLGVDCTRLEAKPRTLAHGETLRVVLCARYAEKKGIRDAIAAVQLAAEAVDLTLTIIGDAERPAEHAEKRRILAALQEHAASGRVTLLGDLPYAAYVARMDHFHIALQPSKTAANGDTEGGAPVALVELCASGLPAVATRHADIPNVVEDGVTGLLAAEGDVEALAHHLVTFARNPELISEFGRRAAARVRERFDLTACRASLVAHYREAVALAS